MASLATEQQNNNPTTEEEEVVLLLKTLQKGVNGTLTNARALQNLRSKVTNDIKRNRINKSVKINEADIAITSLGRPQFFNALYVNAIASLRSNSAELSTDSQNNILHGTGNGNPPIDIDVLVIGAGIHDQIFTNIMKDLDSKLNILSVGDGLYVSMNTHNADTRVFANSSTRASQEPVMNVDSQVKINQPGMGNINYFPGGKLQLSTVSNSKYQTLSQFSQVATVNRFMSGIPILLGYNVTKVEYKETKPKYVAGQQRPGRQFYEVTLESTFSNINNPEDAKVAAARAGLLPSNSWKSSPNRWNGKEIKIRTPVIVDASGIGGPDYSGIKFKTRGTKFKDTGNLIDVAYEMKRKVEELILRYGSEKVNWPIRVKQEGYEVVPRISHSQDFYRALTMLSDPYEPFVGKTVVMIGTGDSSRTILEFLFRINAASSAYGDGSNDSGVVKRVYWCGRSVRKSRDEYKKSNGERPRYAVLAAAYNLRTSDIKNTKTKQTQKVLIPIAARVKSLIETKDNGKINCVLEKNVNWDQYRGEANRDITNEDLRFFKSTVRNNILDAADYVVIATGLRPNFQCYSDSLGDNVYQSAVTAFNEPNLAKKSAEMFIDNSDITMSKLPEELLKQTTPQKNKIFGNMQIPIKALQNKQRKNILPLSKHGRKHGIFFVGPRGGTYYTKEQLEHLFNKEIQKVFEISENLVSIFLLAPITAQTAAYVNLQHPANGRFNTTKYCREWKSKVANIQKRFRIGISSTNDDNREYASEFPLLENSVNYLGPSLFLQKETRLLGAFALEFIAARFLIILWKHFTFENANETNDSWVMKVRIKCASQYFIFEILNDNNHFIETREMACEMKRRLEVREGLFLALLRDQFTEVADDNIPLFSRNRSLQAKCVIGANGIVDVARSVVNVVVDDP